ncbi:MAG TPA: hypothetical protein VHZ02_04520 [Acidimicrobiales bacterium]|nr:hypothetical protein [Acidimicrobiales bacterium]
MSPESKTHKIAVLKQDNGELQEDVVERTVVDDHDGGEGEAQAHRSDDSDAEGTDSSHLGEADGSGDESRHDRVVHSTTVEEVAERSHPAEPIPGTLPRSDT